LKNLELIKYKLKKTYHNYDQQHAHHKFQQKKILPFMSVPQHITYCRLRSLHSKIQSMIQTKADINAAAEVLMGWSCCRRKDLGLELMGDS
jgi:hypothetical protein